MKRSQPIEPRRIDRADGGKPDLLDHLADLRQPLAGEGPISRLINPLVREGELFQPKTDHAVRCFACGHRCLIHTGGRGICQVRYNLGGKLYVPWGYVAALQCDPTEKKPFNHVLPGSDTLTFGMLGCDLHCSYCQNWDISQALRDSDAGRQPSTTTPQELIALARRNGAQCVASSYNEPLITSEWARAIFTEAQAAGLTCLYVSNGNATREVLDYIRPYTDGYKIDLKSMSDKTYRKLGAVLTNVLDGIRLTHQMGFWVEIVTLVIPGFNSSEGELRDAARFIRSISPDIPWHVTAFHQDYRMLTPDNTDTKLLIRAAEIGMAEGLRYVYAGNMPGRVGPYEHTLCPGCHIPLVKRFGYIVLEYRITDTGQCPRCQTTIAGLWPKSKETVRLGSPNDLFSRMPRPMR